MSQILVRDLSPETVDELKQRAKQNRRSLQAEVRAILEEAAREAERALQRQQRTDELRQLAAWSRQQHGPQTSDSVDLIREDRDR
ncbi:MAG: hypothetical protein GEU75_08805 [Dehalococcoidia bacterium]|nr:hypothetical protein [Dehalococcoidia bacterium]